MFVWWIIKYSKCELKYWVIILLIDVFWYFSGFNVE